VNAPTSWAFGALLNGVRYTCTANAAVGPMAPMLVSARGYFDITWDSNGNCTYLDLDNLSYYVETW
jgi:hypothetical protein